MNLLCHSAAVLRFTSQLPALYVGCQCRRMRVLLRSAEDRVNIQSSQRWRSLGLFSSQSGSHPRRRSQTHTHAARTDTHSRGSVVISAEVPFVAFSNQHLCSVWPRTSGLAIVYIKSHIVNKGLTPPWFVFMMASYSVGDPTVIYSRPQCCIN